MSRGSCSRSRCADRRRSCNGNLPPICGDASAAGSFLMNPNEEEKHWREHHEKQPFVKPDQTYEHWAPAYRTGYEGAHKNPGKNFSEMETDLEAEYSKQRPIMPWDEAKSGAWLRGSRDGGVSKAGRGRAGVRFRSPGTTPRGGVRPPGASSPSPSRPVHPPSRRRSPAASMSPTSPPASPSSSTRTSTSSRRSPSSAPPEGSGRKP